MFNVFKRPMFRRGGSPTGTGIMSHVEPRKNFNAGARGTGASNMAQFLKNQANRYRAAGRIGPNPMFGPPNSNSLIPFLTNQFFESSDFR